jgi:hypothetical protein
MSHDIGSFLLVGKQVALHLSQRQQSYIFTLHAVHLILPSKHILSRRARRSEQTLGVREEGPGGRSDGRRTVVPAQREAELVADQEGTAQVLGRSAAVLQARPVAGDGPPPLGSCHRWPRRQPLRWRDVRRRRRLPVWSSPQAGEDHLQNQGNIQILLADHRQ